MDKGRGEGEGEMNGERNMEAYTLTYAKQPLQRSQHCHGEGVWVTQ